MRIPWKPGTLQIIRLFALLILLSFSPVRADEAPHACRLFGIVGTAIPESTAHQMLEGLQLLGDEKNPHGWGIVFFPGDTENCRIMIPTAYRGAGQANGSSDYDYAQKKAMDLPRVLVAHVRKSSSGCTGLPDPHPFVKERQVFAHNGDIDEDILLNLISPDRLLCPPTSPDYIAFSGEDRYIDSELYFISVMQKIGETRDWCSVTSTIHRAVWDLVKELERKNRPRKLNMIYSDGEALWAVRYASEKTDYYTIYFAIAEGEEDWRAVSSTPLAGYKWTLLRNYRMVCLRPGKAPAIYDLTRNPYMAEPERSAPEKEASGAVSR